MMGGGGSGTSKDMKLRPWRWRGKGDGQAGVCEFIGDLGCGEYLNYVQAYTDKPPFSFNMIGKNISAAPRPIIFCESDSRWLLTLNVSHSTFCSQKAVYTYRATLALTPSVVISYKLPRQFISDLCPRPGRYEAAFRSQLEELGEDVHQLAPWLSLDSLLDMYGKALYRNLGTLLLVIHVSRPCCRQTCALLQEYINPMGRLANETP